MAIIKCEYTKSYCNCDDRKEVSHSDLWFCDSEIGCEIGMYSRPFGSKIINPTCIYCSNELIRFEKSCKQYELHMENPLKGFLKIGRMIIDLFTVNYLEIDGKVYINFDERNENEQT